jgi:hypothetical protein
VQLPANHDEIAGEVAKQNFVLDLRVLCGTMRWAEVAAALLDGYSEFQREPTVSMEAALAMLASLYASAWISYRDTVRDEFRDIAAGDEPTNTKNPP